MKKNDCNVVRDLMPLVVDRVASDESREMVEDHITSCEECRKQYEEMKAELPEETRAEYEEEQRTIVEALRTVKRQQKKRRIRKTVLLAAVCMIAVFCAGLLLTWLDNGDWPVDNKRYSLELAQLQDGRIIVTENLQFHASSYGTLWSYDEEDGKNIQYWTCHVSPLRYVNDGTVIGKGNWIILDNTEKGPDELRQGTPKDYITVWKKGDAVPAASEEMERFFALIEQTGEQHFYEPHGINFRYDDEESDVEETVQVLETLQQSVPEWK